MRASILAMVLLGICPAYAQQPQEITNSIGMKFASISAGSFIMGSPEKEVGRHPNETSHRVTISESFYLGQFEVTQDEYEKVTGTNPSTLKGSQHPVETLDWEDAVAFCRKLSELPEEKAAGRVYRLPTEAEWEYACRAEARLHLVSVTLRSCFPSMLGSLKTPKIKHHPVGEKKPNQWGLFDMLGNVGEWCDDWYGDYPMKRDNRSTWTNSWHSPGYSRWQLDRRQQIAFSFVTTFKLRAEGPFGPTRLPCSSKDAIPATLG